MSFMGWILPRRRGNSWLQFFICLILFWWLTLFGFNQEFNSDFGEQLDRNFITKVVTTRDFLYNEGVATDSISESFTNNEVFVNGNKNVGSEFSRQWSRKEFSPKHENMQKQAVGFIVPENNFGIASPGEMGTAVNLPTNLPPDIQIIVDEGWKRNSFNQYVSEMISLHRSLPDTRPQYCKDIAKDYKNLPETSIIVTFHQEAWSTLLRTVHSILDRSPDYLVREIILVDDFSDLDHLQKPLEDYLKNYSKVKIIRTTKREGLIRARLLGVSEAKASVITFLDSHIECTTGWLEPLLDRIARNSTNVVCPVIDAINPTSFQLHSSDSRWIQVGGFEWNLSFKWEAMQESEKKRKKHPCEPTRSPTMAGGLFSIDKRFFEKLGYYDPGFEIWGGENLELSFKTWMCGGTLEIIPCSHVGHIFRTTSPYKVSRFESWSRRFAFKFQL